MMGGKSLKTYKKILFTTQDMGRRASRNGQLVLCIFFKKIVRKKNDRIHKYNLSCLTKRIFVAIRSQIHFYLLNYLLKTCL